MNILSKYFLFIICVLFSYTDSKIKVGYIANNKNIHYVATSIASLIDSADPEDNIRIFIFEENLNDNMKAKLMLMKTWKRFSVEFVKLNKDMLNNSHEYLDIRDIINTIKFLKSEKLQKIILLDSHTLILKSLRPLYNSSNNNGISGLQITSLHDNKTMNTLHTEVLLINLGASDLYSTCGVLEQGSGTDLNKSTIIINNKDVGQISLKWNVGPNITVNSVDELAKQYNLSTTDINEAKNEPVIITFPDFTYLYLDNPYFQLFQVYFKVTLWKNEFEDLILANHRHKLIEYTQTGKHTSPHPKAIMSPVMR